MMMMTNPITPPLELLDLVSSGAEAAIATKILQWAAPILRQQGADQELEACLRYAGDNGLSLSRMRAARRPKLPSLKEQALNDLDTIQTHDSFGFQIIDLSNIRRALEALDD
jgi:hypothetical protein